MKFIHFALFFLILQCVLAQNSTETYYNKFDGLVSSYTSDLNTGQLFEDVFLTISDNEYRFFETSVATVGSLTYNNQKFYKQFLKYDLLEDNLLLHCVYESNQYDIILDKSLVNSFSIYGKNFTKLPIEAASFSFYKNGYFEIISSTDSYNLYAKYDKSKSEKLGNKKIYFTYAQNEKILFEYNSVFYEINSKNNVVKILKDRKSDINQFYKNYANLERQNKVEFYKKLFNNLFNSY